MTDTSTNGLLPQLNDVLRALTDSHALLLSKIQSVRLEQISAAYPMVEMLGEFSDSQVDLGTPSRVDTTISPMIDVPEAVHFSEVESGAQSTRIVSSEFESSPGSPVTPTDVADHMVTTPLPAAPVEIATPHDDLAAVVSVRSPLVPDGRETLHADPTDAESENRNYNFFDELDARLAGLGDAESAGDR